MLSRTAIRQLMAQAAGAGSLEAVYQTALRVVQEALSVERASLLVFDAGGAMRFVAWSGLSDRYRMAVDGHSPWAIDETAAMPLLVADVEQEPSLAAFLPMLRAEAVRALAFVPLQFGTRLLGKFVLYYQEPHAFSDAEIGVVQQIADHVAFALEHHRVAVELESRLVVERELRCRAETDAALREANERRLSLAMGAGRLGAWDWDIAANVVKWSSETAMIHGIDVGAFDGSMETVKRFVHRADRDRFAETVGAALAAPDSEYSIEYRIVRTDGALRWLGAQGRVIVDADGRPTRMIGVCRDVTARKRAEEASQFLASASRVFATTLAPETVIQNLVHLVVPRIADWCILQTIEADGHLKLLEIAHANSGLTGLVRTLLTRWPSRPEHVGSAASVAASGRSQLIPRVTPEMLAARADDDPEQLAMLREMRCESAIAVPLKARGRTLGVLTLVSSDPERIYDEADLRVAEDFASRASLAIDNARLYVRARSAVQTRDEMIAFVSHDLRDPLQSIAAAAATLRLQPHSAEDAESLESIALASAQMGRLVQDLLDISLIEAGRLPLERESVCLAELIAETQRLLAPQIRAKGAHVETRLSSSLPRLWIDRHRTLQVLLNLMSNALKFGPHGVAVTMGAEAEDDAVRVSVRDSGAGIVHEHIDHVFERFWRADRGAGSGSGLGLAVARGIVEAHGGRIGVTSHPGAGSTFFFTMPLEPELCADPGAGAVAAAHEGSTPSVA
jgi:PAS domain S-box-containing protein